MKSSNRFPIPNFNSSKRLVLGIGNLLQHITTMFYLVHLQVCICRTPQRLTKVGIFAHVNTVVISNLQHKDVIAHFKIFTCSLCNFPPPTNTNTQFSLMLLRNKSKRDLGSKTLQSNLLWRQNFPRTISRSLSTVLLIFFRLFQQQRSYSNLLKFFDQFSVLMQL